jgi:cellulose synthase/poly-beta-1,6-N-acetylglucosamine synthase-like glycosyltransferase
MSVLLFALSALALWAALHPFTTYPLSLVLLKRMRAPKTSVSHDQCAVPRSFAVCMCAYNEERVIAAKIENLLALRVREPGLQILVYVDGATDGTAQILQRYADRIDLYVSPERKGKTCGMNLLCTRTDADVLVFTDANVILDPGCFDELRRHFADPSVGCVCGNLQYTNASESVTAASGSMYWRFEQRVKLLESELGSTMGADGSIFAVRQHLRRAPPGHIIDDMYVSFLVLCEGSRVIQVQDVRAYEDSVTAAREEFKRKVRIACQAFNVHKLIWPRLRRLDRLTRYQYVSHKLMRWLSIYFLAAAAALFIAALWSTGASTLMLALIATAVLVLALGRIFAIKPVLQIIDVLVALAGAGYGVWRSLRGERYQIWTPAASIRERR